MPQNQPTSSQGGQPALTVLRATDGHSAPLSTVPGERLSYVQDLGVLITSHGNFYAPASYIGDGYVKVRGHNLHKLVMLAFGPPPPDDGRWVVRHLDGDKTNNHINNLSWGTDADNLYDAQRHGKMPHRKLTREQVIELRKRARAGETLANLAEGLDVGLNAVSNAVRGNSWQCVTEEPPVPAIRRNATPGEKRKAVRLFREGYTAEMVAEMQGRDRKTILNWAHAAGVRKYKT